MHNPQSCDTFVVLPPFTKNGAIIFGKNSDRTQHEVQEIVFVKGGLRDANLKCTYITIEESPNPVNTVILSKPAWMWGAEMGANDKNVVIGNEAVWTNFNEGDGDASEKRLLGMDLVRLGLERGNSAEHALTVITELLEKYGQGGPCSDTDATFCYHNSFLIADTKEAWVLETSGKMWAAEKVDGFRNISNILSIGTKIDKHSSQLKDKAKLLGLWDGQSEFNFTKAFSSGGDEQRLKEGEKLLKQGSSDRQFDVKNMFTVLRHKEHRICRGCDDTFPTQGSQVSRLSPTGTSVHWFTGTPDPSISFFKPFIFTSNAKISEHTISSDEPKREHHLYKLHWERVVKGNNENLLKLQRVLEDESFRHTMELVNKFDSEPNPSSQPFQQLFKNSVEAEVKLYTSH